MYKNILRLLDKLRIIICKPWFLFHTLDVTFFKISVAIYRCLMFYSLNDHKKLKNDIMSNSNHFFPIYSCRSGFDAILQILSTYLKSNDQPEIIMTGLNIKHMRMLPEIHGYKVKILDIDLDTMEPNLVQLKNLITPNTHVLVVAQFNGVHIDLEPMARIVKENNNIIIIEDCAQSINSEYIGSCHADFTLFSFGLSKDYTAFGGGLIKVHNNRYQTSISNLLDTYPIESQFKYLTTVTISTIKFIMTSSITVSLVHFISRYFGSNYENVLNKIGKEFNDHDDPRKLLAKFRKQCSTPHLSLIRDRIKEIYDTPNSNKYLLERKMQGDYLTNQLLNIQTIKIFGNKQMKRRYWLFPILVKNKNRDQLLDKLNQNGFIATKTATTFGYIGLEEEESNCFKFREEVIYLPYSPDIPRIKIDEMVKLIKNFK